MYVAPDVLAALADPDDPLHRPAVRTLRDRDDLHTSVLAYADLFATLAGSDRVDVARAVADLLEIVPVDPPEHGDAVLAAAAFLEEGLSPAVALQAGVAATADERVLSGREGYGKVGLERVGPDPGDGG